MQPNPNGSDAEPKVTGEKRKHEELKDEAAEVAAGSDVSVSRPFSVPAEGRLHLLPFLLPTATCDCHHPTMVAKAREIVPRGSDPVTAGNAVRMWIRENIAYRLDDKGAKASETLAKGVGMCTNKANLQCALLRASGIPCGYKLVHITKECYRNSHMIPELFDKISEPTVHCFAAVFIPDDASGKGGDFLNFDSTERIPDEGKTEKFLEFKASGESQYSAAWLRGPIGPCQANLDHMLMMKPSARWALARDLFDRQNVIYQKTNNVAES